MNLVQVKGQALTSARTELKTFLDKLKNTDGGFDVNAEAEEQMKALEAKCASLKTEFDLAERYQNVADFNENELKALTASGGSTMQKLRDMDDGDFKKFKHGKLKAFKEEKEAYTFGRWILGTLCGDTESANWCTKNGIKAMSGFNNLLGGALVPDEFGATLIDLREIFGVARDLATHEPMNSDTKMIPRRVGGATAYWVAEGTAPTASDLNFDNVQLVAKKLAALTVFSTELSEDAVINIGDRVALELGYQFAIKEDDALFNGDASSGYGGITGFRQKFTDLGSTANGYTQAAATGSWANIVLKDIINACSKLPVFADSPRCQWVCSRQFYFQVIVTLATALSGERSDLVYDSQGTPMFLGYPVKWAQKMPTSTGSSQIALLFGDFSMAASFGDRRDMRMALSDQYKFAEDQLAIKATERIDIIVHDIGNLSTSTTPLAGPVVCLST